MRILVTNDDGIAAPGLDVLAGVAASLAADVTIVAPDLNQSGTAHSLTLHEPMRLRELGPKRFSVKGTPTDCVIMAVKHLMAGAPPDLILSGVNWGANIADDITYSGTVAGAIEGALLGIPSIALSQACNFDTGSAPLWETAASHAPGLLARLIKAGWPQGVFLNVNFPDCAAADVTGTRVTHQGVRDPAVMSIEARQDPRGHAYFWLGFNARQPASDAGSDLAAIQARAISVTPLHLDATHYESCRRLAAALG